MKNNESGILVDEDNIKDLQAEVIDLLINREKSKSISDEGKSYIRNFTWSNSALKSKKMYDNVLYQSSKAINNTFSVKYNMKKQVVSPHCDDAEIGMGGTILDLFLGGQLCYYNKCNCALRISKW